MRSTRVKSGDIVGMIDWLDAPENRTAAADAVSYGHGKPSDLVNFMVAHDEFREWSPQELENAIEVANEHDLMETKFPFKPDSSKQLLEKFIKKQVFAALKEANNKVSVGEVEQMMLDISSRLRLLSSELGDLAKTLPRLQGVVDWQNELNGLNKQVMAFFQKIQKSLADYDAQERTPLKGVAP